MPSLYQVMPFLGSAKSGASVQSVSNQLEAVLNEGAAGSDFTLRVLAPVSIQVQPGCIARLLGTGPSWTVFDQVIMGPVPSSEGKFYKSADTAPIEYHQRPTVLAPSSQVSNQAVAPGFQPGSDTAPSAFPDSLVRAWTNIPRNMRIFILGAVGLALGAWLGSGGQDPKTVSVNAPQAGPQPGLSASPHPPITATSPPTPVPTSPAQVSQHSVQRPVFRVGDRWLSEVTDHQNARLNYQSERSVVEVSAEKVVTSVRTLKSNYTRTIEYTPDWALRSSRLPNGSTTVFSPALPYMRFPAELGKSWSERVVETTSNGAERIHQIDASVLRWEKVRVPAGTFQALRVELSDQISVDGALVHSGTDVSWYVPQIKRSVKSEETSLNIVTGERRRRTIALLEFSVQ